MGLLSQTFEEFQESKSLIQKNPPHLIYAEGFLKPP